MAGGSPHLVKSARRVMEVLEYFDGDRPAAKVTDLSRALSYPQSSTSDLLRSLWQLGYLHYNRRDRTYRPTARVGLLGSWGELFRGGKVLAAVDRIAERVSETVVLSCGGVDYAVHHVHVVRGASEQALTVHLGQSGLLSRSIQGELLLASYPDPQIRLALHRLNAEEADPERRVSIARKSAELQALRERGWAIRHGAPSDEPAAAAILLPRKRGGDRLVLSIIASEPVIEERGEEFIKIMLEERRDLAPPEQGGSAGRSDWVAADDRAAGWAEPPSGVGGDEERSNLLPGK